MSLLTLDSVAKEVWKMDGCLALAVCDSDDVPAALVPDRHEAVRIAESLQDYQEKEARACDNAYSAFQSGRVIEFREGRPSASSTARSGAW
jgi:uncharacterized protein YbaA (DUF1428 family)